MRRWKWIIKQEQIRQKSAGELSLKLNSLKEDESRRWDVDRMWKILLVVEWMPNNLKCIFLRFPTISTRPNLLHILFDYLRLASSEVVEDLRRRWFSDFLKFCSKASHTEKHSSNRFSVEHISESERSLKLFSLYLKLFIENGKYFPFCSCVSRYFDFYLITSSQRLKLEKSTSAQKLSMSYRTRRNNNYHHEDAIHAYGESKLKFAQVVKFRGNFLDWMQKAQEKMQYCKLDSTAYFISDYCKQ